MDNNNYKYDVAFSFLAEDEQLATEINDLIKDRLQTFIYYRRQGEIAGTDGERTFNRVFGTESRIVFVLYRKGWGETSWTRIEETAIRNRAYEEGYDFVIFALLEKPATAPNYLPKNRIWVGLDRGGVLGAASVIEFRVQEAGGSPREETVGDHAKRLAREINAEKERTNLLDSDKGVKQANNELLNLFTNLKQAVSEIPEGDFAIKLHIEHDNRSCVIYCEGYTLFFNWSQSFSNTLKSSALYISLFDGRLSIDGRRFGSIQKPKRLKEIEYSFSLDRTNQPVWQEVSVEQRSHSSTQFGKLALSMLLEQVKKQKRGQT